MISLNELLGAELPFIQGAMANIATGSFAADCANAGALGVMAIQVSGMLHEIWPLRQIFTELLEQGRQEPARMQESWAR